MKERPLHEEDVKPNPFFYAGAQPEDDQSGLAQPRALFSGEAKPATGEVILTRTDPYSIALEFVRRKYFRQGVLALYYKGDAFWRWNGSFYEELELALLIAEVYGFIASAKRVHGEGTPVRIVLKPDDVNDVIKCVKAGTTIPAKLPQPCWIDTETPAPELFAFKNALVNVRTGERLEPTPRLWITDAGAFNYNPSAQCLRWNQFLEEIHPNDEEAQNCIEEQLGYGMTYDMQFEKIAVWIGLPRAGKSTLLHIQQMLIGKGAFAPMSFNDWMRGEKSRENLIGKKVLAFPDVRLKPPKTYGTVGYDPSGLDHGSIQMLLNISGRDSKSIGRMYKRAWEGELQCKIIITSNDPLNIHDPVLLTRLVMVDFQQSFLDRADRDDYLREKLDAELSGIANKCLAAYRRLLGRGHFIQPKSAARLARKIGAKVSPIAAFMEDCWVKDDKAKGPLGSEVFASFVGWCHENSQAHLIDSNPRSQELFRTIRQIPAYAWLHGVKQHGAKRRYAGLRPRKDEDETTAPKVAQPVLKRRRL
jgi:putative DNA primase/helicase